MLLRDRLQARLAEMGRDPDYVRLAQEVLAIRNAPPDLARRLVAQALVIEDRQDAWTIAGQRIVEKAPAAPAVYLLKDETGKALYVGKAVNLRRRLRAHFAKRRWRGLKPDFVRIADAEWMEVGSELEALLREAEWIRDFAPALNIQRGPPSPTRPIPPRLMRDVVVILPSIETDSVELIATRKEGPTFIQRTRRSGEDLGVHVRRIWKFFFGLTSRRDQTRSPQPLSPLVYSWLATRGSNATRIEMLDVVSHHDLRVRLLTALASSELFAERIVLRNSDSRR